MKNEPIRLPAWVVSVLLLIVLPGATALLEGQEWKPVLIGTLGVVTILLGVAETVRAFTDSPATKVVRQQQAGVGSTAGYTTFSPVTSNKTMKLKPALEHASAWTEIKTTTKTAPKPPVAKTTKPAAKKTAKSVSKPVAKTTKTAPKKRA